jgi:hypothetical protein
MLILEGVVVFGAGIFLLLFLGTLARAKRGGWFIQREIPSDLVIVLLISAISLGCMMIWTGFFKLSMPIAAESAASLITSLAVLLVAVRLFRIAVRRMSPALDKAGTPSA